MNLFHVPVTNHATLEQFPPPTASPAAHELLRRSKAPSSLCGFLDHTFSWVCLSDGTCKFNTDYKVAGCCNNDICTWATTCYDSTAATACTGACLYDTLVGSWYVVLRTDCAIHSITAVGITVIRYTHIVLPYLLKAASQIFSARIIHRSVVCQPISHMPARQQPVMVSLY